RDRRAPQRARAVPRSPLGAALASRRRVARVLAAEACFPRPLGRPPREGRAPRRRVGRGCGRVRLPRARRRARPAGARTAAVLARAAVPACLTLCFRKRTLTQDMAYRDAMDALGDRTRRAIFELLRSGPLAVGEIADELPVSRPAVSQHLRVLKEAGLVTERRNGTRRIYRLDPDGLGELRDYFDDFWSEA